mgnify:CR=1 FL=1
MCIRDRTAGIRWRPVTRAAAGGLPARHLSLVRTRTAHHVAVSYTHLTLPTSDLVEISVVAVSLKKKKNINIQQWYTIDNNHITKTTVVHIKYS